MKNRDALRERFKREPLANKLGELAVSLSLFASFSADHADHREIASGLLNEPVCYAEWTAPDTSTELQAELTEIHQQLTRWQQNWESIWSDETRKPAVITQARAWSEHLLDVSGLLQPAREVA